MSARGRGVDWGAVTMAATVMIVEGYDLVIYGNTLPVMLKDPGMGLTVTSAGTVGSAVFVGMLLGGLSVGALVRRLGVKGMLAVGIGCFSVAMAGAALAHHPWALGLFRLMAGWGLGAVMPACMAMTRQSSTSRSGPLDISAVMAGIPLGGIVASIFTYLGVGALGWRGLFGMGALLSVLLLPFVSLFAKRVATRTDAAPTRQGEPVPRSFRFVVAIGCLATFCFLLTFYGLVTWLPKLMIELRVPLEGALQLALVLNAGGVIGSVITGYVATRLGPLRTLGAAGVVCAAMLLAIPSGLVSGIGLMVVVTVLGMVAPTTQNLVNAIVAEIVPEQSRAASLGRTLGVGRLGAITAPLIGSWLLANIPQGIGPHSGAGAVFMTFAGVCALGVVVSSLFPKMARHALTEETANG